MLDVQAFGASSKLAVRALLTAFRERGWEESGDAALSIIRALERRPRQSATRLASDAPAAFLRLNGISRADLAATLAEVAVGRGGRKAKGPSAPSRSSYSS
jgi:hypothetical protein